MVMLVVFLIVVALLLGVKPSGATAAAGLVVLETRPTYSSTGVLRDAFPVSGFQITMIVLVVVVLIAGGIALRRLSRPRPPEGPEDTSPPGDADDTTGSDETP